MGLFTKLDMYSFADFYHRFATTGLTFDEMFFNWQKFNKQPRDIDKLAKIPKKLKEQIDRVKPPATKLWQLLNVACKIHGEKKEDVNSKNSKRELATIRQQVCYVGLELGFEPRDYPLILKWDRSLTYARAKKCKVLAEGNKDYRETLNELLKRFGQEQITP